MAGDEQCRMVCYALILSDRTHGTASDKPLLKCARECTSQTCVQNCFGRTSDVIVTVPDVERTLTCATECKSDNDSVVRDCRDGCLETVLKTYKTGSSSGAAVVAGSSLFWAATCAALMAIELGA